MESRSAARTYGAVDDSTHGSLRWHSEKSSQGDFQANQVRSLLGRKYWFTIATTFLAVLGTILLSATPRASQSSLTTTPAVTTPVAERSGSVFTEQFPTLVTGAAARSKISEPEIGHVVGSSVEPLDFTVTNFYHLRDGKPGAQIPWLEGVKLAEPYRDTTLSVTSPREGYTYKWGVGEGDRDQEFRVETSGTDVTVVFTSLELNSVTLSEVEDISGETKRELRDTVMVKYVRREIRTLTDDEREELLDAVSVK